MQRVCYKIVNKLRFDRGVECIISTELICSLIYSLHLSINNLPRSNSFVSDSSTFLTNAGTNKENLYICRGALEFS